MSSLKEEYPEFEPVFEQVAATLNIGPEPTLTPEPTPTPEPTSTPVAAVLGDSLNIRSGPGQEHAILGSADEGDELEVRRVTPSKDWFLVYTPELGEAWVSAPLVSQGVPLEELPVVANP